MEFTATINFETYTFSSIHYQSYLVCGPAGEFIIYKTLYWKCADDIAISLLRQFGEAIDQQMALRERTIVLH